MTVMKPLIFSNKLLWQVNNHTLYLLTFASMADCPVVVAGVVGVATVGAVGFPATVGFLDGVGIPGLLGLAPEEDFMATK